LLLKDDELVRTEMAASRNLLRVERAGKPAYVWVNPPSLAREEQVLLTMWNFPIRDSRSLVPFRVSAAATKQVWLTFHVPETAVSGRYFGKVLVRGGGSDLVDIPIELKVHSFDLAESKVRYSIFYRAQLDPAKASIGSEYRNVEQVRNELQDLRNHGVLSPTLYQLTSDRILLRRMLQLWKDEGIARGPLFYLGIQTTESSLGNFHTAAPKNLDRMFDTIGEAAESFGFSKVYVYGSDEAEGPELSRQRELWKRIQRLGGGVFVAGYSGAHALVGDVLDVQINYGKHDASEAQKWHSRGKQIYSYANPQSGPENPYLFRLNYGLMLWAHDYDGAMPYAYQHCFGSCWNDVDHPVYRDHNMTYPTADGIIPTLAWEGFREARDDVRYLATLQEALDSASNGPASKAARAFLRELRADLRHRSSRSKKYNADVRLDLDRLRKTVVSHIEMLQ
jgi:hypothetical protein